MTRAEKVAVAQELRRAGLLHREIAERMGVRRQTVVEYLNDPDGTRGRKRRRRWDDVKHPCATPHCDNPVRRYSRLCKPCQWAEAHRLQVARRREIERLWLAGYLLREIAVAVDTTKGAIGVAIADMRSEGGYNLPHRRPRKVAA